MPHVEMVKAAHTDDDERTVEQPGRFGYNELSLIIIQSALFIISLIFIHVTGIKLDLSKSKRAKKRRFTS